MDLRIATIGDLQQATASELSIVKASLTPLRDLDEYLETRLTRDYRYTYRSSECRHCGGTGIAESHPRLTGVFHPSGFGICLRRDVLDLYGFEDKVDSNISTTLLKLFDTGHYVHDQLQSYCHAMYGEAFKSEVEGEHELYPFFGSMDGELDWPEYLCRCAFEYKTINEKGFKALGNSPKPVHVRQGTIYQRIHDLPFMVYWYYNKNDSTMREFVVEFDFHGWAAIEERAEQALEYFVKDDLPKRDIHPFQCTQCDYNPICMGGDRDPRA